MFIKYNINHWYSKFSFCRTKSWTYTLLPTEKRWKHNDLRSRDTSRGSDDINIHAYEYSLDSRNCWKYANTLHIILHTSSDFCKNVWYIVLYFRRKSLILWNTCPCEIWFSKCCFFVIMYNVCVRKRGWEILV